MVERLKRNRRAAHLDLVSVATRFPNDGLLALIRAALAVLELDEAIAGAGTVTTVITRTDHVEVQDNRTEKE